MSKLFSHHTYTKLFVSLIGIFFLFTPNIIFALLVPIPVTDPLPPVPTADSAMRTKEVSLTIAGITFPGVSLDNIAIMIMREIVNAIGNYTVSWINSGFKSRENGTGFPLDLESTLKNTGDAIAGQIINQAVGGNGAVCSPFRADLKIALTNNANFNSRTNSDNFVGSCPLTNIIKNGDQGIKDFMKGDFVQNGGWDSWNAMTQNPNGNPYSSMFGVQASIDSRILNALGLQKEQLNWGKGFIASQDCDTYVANAGNKVILSPGAKFDPSQGKCVHYGPVKSPGSVVEAQLQKVFGSEVDQLNVAANFNQVLSALVGQLQNIILSKTKGLFDPNGSGKPGNYNGNKNPNDDTGFGTCSADKEFAIQDKDTVTWSYSGVSDSNTTFVWSGTEGLTGTSSTVSKIYTSEKPNPKIAQVIATRKVLDGTFDETKDPPVANFTIQSSGKIDCTSNVIVSKYGPLALSCRATDMAGNSIPNRVKPGTTILWEVNITGGSGSLIKIDINEGKSFGVVKKSGRWTDDQNDFVYRVYAQTLFPIAYMQPATLRPSFVWGFNTGPVFWFKNGGVRPNGGVLPIPQTTIPDKLPVTKALVLKLPFIYQDEGTFGLSFDGITDEDPYVPQLNGVSCSPDRQFTVDPDLP